MEKFTKKDFKTIVHTRLIENSNLYVNKQDANSSLQALEKLMKGFSKFDKSMYRKIVVMHSTNAYKLYRYHDGIGIYSEHSLRGCKIYVYKNILFVGKIKDVDRHYYCVNGVFLYLE